MPTHAFVLIALYPLIWLLDLSWWQMSPDAIIIVGLLPVAWFFIKRFPLVESSDSEVAMPTIIASIALAFGVFLNQLTLMAFSWSWLAVLHLFHQTSISSSRIWILCTGAFPWVLVDGEAVGWLFRLSGASITSLLFDSLGLNVITRGTQLYIGGLPISIEAACGGLQLLQVLMSSGIALNLMRFPKERTFWIMLLMLPVLAWAANTLRIIVISAWGVAYGAEAAAGAFHTWGALFVVITMFAFYLLFSDVIVRLLK